MKVKKYTAPTMPEAMNQIRKELGSEAVILNSKVVKTRGFLGFFRKNNIEVIAAQDPHLTKEKPKQTIKESNPSTSSFASPPKKKIEPLQDENLLNEIRKLRDSLANQQGNKQAYSYPEPIQGVYNHLVNQEIETKHAITIADSLLEKYYLNKRNVSPEELSVWLMEELKTQLNHYSFGYGKLDKQVIHFVGPTGVGKTTTIAKIAAHAIMNEGRKIALITMDTYRIGAIDQLKTYSKILDIPIEVAYNYEDFMAAKKKFANFDNILVDTAGRNYKQIEFINQLSKNIDYSDHDEMFLVLSATTKLNELKRTYKQFANFEIEKIIFTKIDEISEYGTLLNMILDCQVGIAYMTNGQNVPDDFMVASVEKIASMIVGEWKND